MELVPKDPLWKLELAGWIIERFGFHGVWISEHPHNRSSLITAAHLLKRLRRPWIGLGVLNPYIFNPLSMAQAAASLTELAPGRVLLGIGAGDKTSLESAGLERRRPLESVEKAVKIVRALLEEGVCEGFGVRARLDFKSRSRVPVYVGAQGARMLRLGGRVGDGVLINHSRLNELRWAMREVSRGAEEVGRDAKRLDLAAYLTVSIGDDESKAVKTAAPYAAYILCGASQWFLERIGADPAKVEEIREVVRRRDWLRLYEIIPKEYVERATAVGRPSMLRELVAQLIDLGYTQVVFGAPLGPRVLAALKAIRDIVVEFEGS